MDSITDLLLHWVDGCSVSPPAGARMQRTFLSFGPAQEQSLAIPLLQPRLRRRSGYQLLPRGRCRCFAQPGSGQPGDDLLRPEPFCIRLDRRYSRYVSRAQVTDFGACSLAEDSLWQVLQTG